MKNAAISDCILTYWGLIVYSCQIFFQNFFLLGNLIEIRRHN